MQHKEKFCVVYREILLNRGSSECKYLRNDVNWQELLMLPVNAVWLRKTLCHAKRQDLLRPVQINMNRTVPLTHGLLGRLLGSLSLDFGGGGKDTELRQKHAMETLGVLLYSLLDHSCIDFKQQILPLFCEMEAAENVFADLITKLVKIIVGAGDVRAQQDGECGRARQHYVQLLAIYAFLTMCSGCTNIDRNSLLDHFVVQEKQLMGMFDSILSNERPVLLKENAFNVLTMLCNHQKHDYPKNPFGLHLKQMKVNEIHMYFFSLREVVDHINSMCVKCTKGTFSTSAQDMIVDWVEHASDSMIAWGVQLTSAFGAWVSGMDPTSKQQLQNKQTMQRMASRQGSGLDDSPKFSLAPLITTSPEEVRCDDSVWCRARFSLITIYELVCSSGGENWMKVCVEHDVPPWGMNGHIPQPLACSQIFLDMITLITFCLHSDSMASHIGLIILRCFTENIQVGSLLFSMGFEETENVDAFHVFERRGARRQGNLGYVTAQRHVKKNKANHHLTHPNGNGSNSSNIEQYANSLPSNQGSSEYTREMARRRYSSNSMNLLERSIASILISQIAEVLIEHNDSPNDSNQQQVGGGSRMDRCRDGALCIRAIDVLHRLFLFEKRVLSHDSSCLQNVEWGLVSKGLFAMLERASMGINTFPDLTPQKYLALCCSTAHLINLILSSDFQMETERLVFIYEILTRRVAIENLCKILDTNKDMKVLGGPRVVSQDMANLVHILFHFTTVVMMIQDVGHEPAPNETKQEHAQKSRLIMAKLAESLPSLRLKPHDRLRDGFQKYVETKEERSLLREYFAQLLGDVKSLRLFERTVKKKL